MLERRRVVLPVLERAPEREVQMRLVRIVAAIALHQSLHGRDLGVAEHVGFQVCETPIDLAEIWIEPEAGLVGLLAFAAMAQSLVQMTDREAQAHFAGIEARRFLKSYQSVRLAHHAGAHIAEHDPVLRVFRLDVEQVANRRLGLGEPPEIDHGLAQSTPGKRQVGRLLEGMAQQPFRIGAAADGE